MQSYTLTNSGGKNFVFEGEVLAETDNSEKWPTLYDLYRVYKVNNKNKFVLEHCRLEVSGRHTSVSQSTINVLDSLDGVLGKIIYPEIKQSLKIKLGLDTETEYL